MTRRPPHPAAPGTPPGWPSYRLPGSWALRHPVRPTSLEGRTGLKISSHLPLWQLGVPMLLALWLLGSLALIVHLSFSAALTPTLVAGITLITAVTLFCVWRLFYRPVQQVLYRWALGKGRLWFAATPLRPGQPLSLEFQRVPRQPLPADGWAQARLTCSEVTVDRSGTTPSYHHKVLWQQTFGATPLYAGQSLLLAFWHTQLPAHLPASRSGRNNLIVWHLQLLEEVSGLTTNATDFVLSVGHDPS